MTDTTETTTVHTLHDVFLSPPPSSPRSSTLSHLRCLLVRVFQHRRIQGNGRAAVVVKRVARDSLRQRAASGGTAVRVIVFVAPAGSHAGRHAATRSGPPAFSVRCEQLILDSWVPAAPQKLTTVCTP